MFLQYGSSLGMTGNTSPNIRARNFTESCSTCEGTHVMRWFRPALLSVARANSPQRVERSPGMSLIAVEHSLCGTRRKWTNKCSKWWLDKKGVKCSVKRMTCPVHNSENTFSMKSMVQRLERKTKLVLRPLFFGKHQHSVARVCDSHYRPHVTTIDRLYTCLCWISHLSYAPVLFVQINCSLCITYGMNSPEMWLIVTSGFSFQQDPLNIPPSEKDRSG